VIVDVAVPFSSAVSVAELVRGMVAPFDEAVTVKF
jgi:hypothetical protein